MNAVSVRSHAYLTYLHCKVAVGGLNFLGKCCHMLRRAADSISRLDSGIAFYIYRFGWGLD